MERAKLKLKKNILASEKSVIGSIDPGVKFLGFVIIVTMLLIRNNDFIIAGVIVDVVLLSLFSRATIKYILRNFLSFGIIFIVPYGFAISASLLFTYFGMGYINNFNISDTLYRIIKIIIIGYLSNLYLYTTSLESLSAMLNKIFKPFKRFSKIISVYTIIIMIVLEEVSEMTGKHKKIFIKSLSGLSFISKIKHIPDIIVEIIISSFERLNEIQKKLKKAKDVVIYKFRFTLRELIFLFVITIQIIVLEVILI